ncbi:hypothetical protein Zm00014a_012291 [Zea mays]|jgi:hypothetical protein|uniref:Uncharacterized protein n=2 Tax=Zea mays TaxID=4577 RepID=B6TZX3_MAIZE|nr:hypothetical protein [Zea mays]PWZ11098.1 hypothetical protein Zm00014a_012291 [Zea mays]
MEGLIPFIYRAVVRYRKEEGRVSLGDLFFDEPSSPTSYFRLPGGADSGRYQQVTSSDLLSSQTTTSTASSGAAGVARRRSPMRCPSHRRRPVSPDP